VATIIYSPNALANLERVFDFLAHQAPEAALAALEAIKSAVATLAHHPMIGRIVEGELRDLVISYGRSGYIALYRFVPSQDHVRILAVRHQRELDYH
jgi:plasmid stabilization system protein ParE